MSEIQIKAKDIQWVTDHGYKSYTGYINNKNMFHIDSVDGTKLGQYRLTIIFHKDYS